MNDEENEEVAELQKAYTEENEAQHRRIVRAMSEALAQFGALGVVGGSGQHTHAMKYILREYTDTPNESRITICDTEEQREAATLAAIYGPQISIDDAMRADLEELRENMCLSFEGDPGLEWINACEVVGPNGHDEP